MKHYENSQKNSESIHIVYIQLSDGGNGRMEGVFKRWKKQWLISKFSKCPVVTYLKVETRSIKNSKTILSWKQV